MVVFGLEIVGMILKLMSLLSGEMCSQLRTMSRSTPEAVLVFKLKLPVPFRFMSNGQYFDGVGFSRVKSKVTWTILTALTYCARLPRVFNNEF